MAATVAPTPNPYAPVVPPRRPDTVRAVIAPRLPPRRPDTAPAVAAPRHSDLQPVAYAMSQYQEPGDPFTAAAQGWLNASMARDGQEAADRQVASVVAGLGKHADLANYVQSGAMKAEDALRIASDRDAKSTSEAEAADRKSKITARLREMEFDDLAADFESGLADEDTIYESVTKRLNPTADDESLTKEQKLLAQINREREAAGQAPLSMEEYLKTDGPRKLSAAETKELFEAQDAITAGEAVTEALNKALQLNDTAWDGPLADAGTTVGSWWGDENSVDTQELKNLVTAQALDQLKAVFGSMPTEGERKILLDIQGSVGQNREVRKRIFERALAAAERRINENKAKAEGIQTGDYRNPGFDPTGSEDGDAGTAPEGVEQDVWDEMTPEERALWQ